MVLRLSKTAGFMIEPVFGHAPVRTCLADTAICDAMVRYEVALAKVQGEIGVVPQEAANAIATLSDTATIDLQTLADGVHKSGVPVPALVASLRQTLEPAVSDWLHWGATSQDVIDTAYCLCYKNALDLLEPVLDELIAALGTKSDANSEQLMLARTRGQLATPISFSLRLAQWAQPLIVLRDELVSVRAAALRVQFGGASGSRQAVAPHGKDIASGLANELGLSDSAPWHGDRSGIRRLANWLTRLVQALAKIGKDTAISARGEIAEARIGKGGGSSTMPHKANPVRSEQLQTLAVLAATLEAGLSNAAVHGEERDGSLWPVEWALLPGLLEMSGAALQKSVELVADLQPNKDAMQARIDHTPSAFAEAIMFALVRTIGRAEAEHVMQELLVRPASMLETLPEIEGVDWSKVLSQSAFSEPADAVARQIFGSAKKLPTGKK